MKVPFSWLKDYVEIDITAQELQDKLFSCGFEVEELTYLGKDVTNVVTGRITKTEKHPDADRLTVCRVDCGAHGAKQICTAATNVFEGAIVPVALDGSTVLHEGGVQKIKTGKLRGVAVEGSAESEEQAEREDAERAFVVPFHVPRRGGFEALGEVELAPLVAFWLSAYAEVDTVSARLFFGLALLQPCAARHSARIEAFFKLLIK